MQGSVPNSLRPTSSDSSFIELVPIVNAGRFASQETAVLVIIDDMNLIARGTEPSIVLQNAVPLRLRASNAYVALRAVSLSGLLLLATPASELI